MRAQDKVDFHQYPSLSLSLCCLHSTHSLYTFIATHQVKEYYLDLTISLFRSDVHVHSTHITLEHTFSPCQVYIVPIYITLSIFSICITYIHAILVACCTYIHLILHVPTPCQIHVAHTFTLSYWYPQPISHKHRVLLFTLCDIFKQHSQSLLDALTLLLT